MNAFQGIINQATSLEVPLVDEVLALLLLGSLPASWETLVVTLSNVGLEGKQLSLARVKSSLLDEEARQKDKKVFPNLTYNEEGTGTGVLRTGTNLRMRSKSRGRPTCFYCGKRRHFQKNYRHFREKKGADCTDLKKSSERNGLDRRHLTLDKKCFSSYRAGDHGFVKMGNEGSCSIVNIGDVLLMTSTGCKLMLKDAKTFRGLVERDINQSAR